MNFNCLGFEYLKNTSKAQNIIINESDHLDSAESDLEIIPVLGRNGDLIVDNESYKNKSITLKCTVIPFEGETMPEALRRINHWLKGSRDYSILKFSDDPYYFEAKYKNAIDLDNKFNLFGEISLLFERKPFKYRQGSTILINKKDTKIFNSGVVPSAPIIKIYGNGEITLYINDQAVIFKNIENNIIVDCDIQDAYIVDDKGVISLQNNRMYSPFPIIETGYNNISWIGEVSKIEILMRTNEL